MCFSHVGFKSLLREMVRSGALVRRANNSLEHTTLQRSLEQCFFFSSYIQKGALMSREVLLT